MSHTVKYMLEYELPADQRSTLTEMEQFVNACKEAAIDIPGIVNLNPPDEMPRERLERILVDPDWAASSPLEDIVSEYSEGTFISPAPEICRLSREIPEALFKLYCLGSDGMQWLIYYKAGKEQVAKAKVTYEKFDQKKLI